jgi:hypothetical protein
MSGVSQQILNEMKTVTGRNIWRPKYKMRTISQSMI